MLSLPTKLLWIATISPDSKGITMARDSFAEFTNSTRTMIAALRGGETVRGIGEGDIAKLEKALNAVHAIDTEQEALKSKLKTKTSELDDAMVDLKETHSILKKYIKAGIPQEGWKEFGINAKR